MKTKFNGKRGLGLLLSVLGLLCFSAASVRADEGDPPTRVARISYVDGAVSFQPGGEGEWGTASTNRTVTVGDKLWTDRDARTELQAGQASIHLASMTALSFLNLDENTIQMRLAEGSVNFRVRELREGEIYEVDAPNLAFTVRQAGAFRIDVSEDGESTRVTVIRGEGEVSAGGQNYTIREGERGEFNGSQDVRYSTSAAPAPDGFDKWSADRDQKEERSVSAKYVSRDTVGYSDLDDYGTWDEVPEYGHVWYPRSVEVGWAPYSSGSWNWVGPWGWTWADDEPWGYAPFHYGRWSYIGNRWGWCPGSIYSRPYWGPAFVGFIGGNNWGFGFGGGVGWFPLGFGEPFCPWYRSSNVYVRNINIYNTRITNVNIINSRNVNNFNYAYAHNVRAVTATSRNNFVNGQAVNRGAFRMNEASLRGAKVTNRVDASPTRQSYLGAAHGNGRVAAPSTAIQNRAVMARTAPSSAASHIPVHTMNPGTFNGNRGGGNPAFNSGSQRPSGGRGFENSGATPARGNVPANAGAMSPRQRELSSDKPQSDMRRVDRGANGSVGSPRANAGSNAPSRTWEAQGNATDRGHAPAAFGRNDRPSTSTPNQPARGTTMTHSDRPPWAGNSSRGAVDSAPRGNPRVDSQRSMDRPNYSNSGRGGNQRTYEPQQRGNSQRPAPSNNNSNRGYSQPRSYNSDRSYSQPRSYSPPRSYSGPSNSGPRSYSAPSYSAPRSYSAPSRSYSAPSRSYSAPSRGNSAPSHSYSAPPSRGSSGSSGGSPRGGGAPHGRR